jgi:tight adherence protein B
MPGLAGRPVPAARPETATRHRAGEATAPDRLTEVVEEALALAARSGLPPTALIRRSATEERRRQAAAQLRAVRRLEVLLVIPAGLCLLPAFVLLGIVPVVLDLILG